VDWHEHHDIIPDKFAHHLVDAHETITGVLSVA
jgi:hypothetical protein